LLARRGLRGAFHCVPVDVDTIDEGTFPRESRGGCPADARARAGDDGDLTGETLSN
jgi:hypothetical protein